MTAIGLTQVTSDQLTRLLRALHRDQLQFPLEMSALMVAGFGDIADRVDALRGLERNGVKAVLVSVLAERRLRGAEHRSPPPPE